MKKTFLHFLCLLFVINSFSQEISQVKFTGGSTLSFISFTTDQKIIIRITDDGKLLEWGNLWEKGHFNYTPGKLQPYMGRVEYYGAEADSVSRGKLKSIGTCFITYYGAHEVDAKAGKIKSIGRSNLDYYSDYDNQAFRGKLKMAGFTILTYYASFENEAFRGNLKSVGNNSITYYSTFDDKLIKGKVKSIGNISYHWYNSNDRREYRGALKSGTAEQMIGGINFIVW
jgi:hypothetical protein